MGALAQDLVRRGWAPADLVLGLAAPQPVMEAIASALSALAGRGIEQIDSSPKGIDYMELLSSGAWNKRGRADTGD